MVGFGGSLIFIWLEGIASDLQKANRWLSSLVVAGFELCWALVLCLSFSTLCLGFSGGLFRLHRLGKNKTAHRMMGGFI